MSSRALIVDDDPRFARALVRMLQLCDVSAEVCPGIPDALHKLQSGLPAVLFVDLYLAGESGHGLVRGLRSIRPDVPIVACSAGATRADLVRLIRSGVTDFLEKPIDRAALRECLQRVFGSEAAAESTTSPPTPSDADAPGRRRPRRAVPFRDRLHARIGADSLEIPPVSPRLRQIQSLFADLHCSITDVLEVVEADPATATSLLRVASTPLYCASSPPSTVREACLRLGNRVTLSLAHEVSLRSLALGGQARGELRDCWRLAAATAHASRALASVSEEADPDLAFLVGLLHNIGELIILRRAIELDAEAPVLFREDILDVQRASHEAVGARVLTTWTMPSEIVRTAGRHHGPSQGIDAARGTFRDLVMGADLFVRSELGGATAAQPEPAWTMTSLPAPAPEERTPFADSLRRLVDADADG